MVSKKNCPRVAPVWSHSSCLPVLLAKGWLWLPTSHSFCKAGASNRDLPERPPGQLFWLAPWECLGQKATHAKRYLLRIAQWTNWAQAFPLGASPQCLSLGTGLWQSGRTRGRLRLKSFLRLPLLIQQTHKLVKRSKPQVSEVLRCLTVRKS